MRIRPYGRSASQLTSVLGFSPEEYMVTPFPFTKLEETELGLFSYNNNAPEGWASGETWGGGGGGGPCVIDLRIGPQL